MRARPGNPRPAASLGRPSHGAARDRPRSRARCSTASVSSTKALASSMPQTNSSNLSATRGSAGSRRASAACAAGQWVRNVGCVRPRRGSTRSSSRRKNRSSQVSSVAQPRPRCGRERRRVLGGRQHIDADIARERFGHGQALDPREVGGDAAAGDDRRQYGAQIVRGLVDQRVDVRRRDDTIPAW